MKFIVYMIVILICVGVLVTSWILQKDKMTSFVMPGPLSAPHAEYENTCTKCHSSFDKTSQNALCLDCHKDVRADIDASEGFHGKSSTVNAKQCKTCHTEHIGRKADIVRLDREIFNHDFTDFPLSGAHGHSTACTACHRANTKFREAPKDCYSCHKEDDRHNGRLGTACQDCHKSTAWRDTFFDHAKTDFLLAGKHRTVSCEACHASQNYKDTPKECVSCHLINDVHDSPIDEHCEQCHNAEGWNKTSYDHNRLTKFFLKDKHAEITCGACHTGLLFQEKLGQACVDCHVTNDIHKGRNGTRCDECHTTKRWSETSFDHDKDTKFPLRGAHKEASCMSCHKDDSRDVKLDTTCGACHVADDIHQGHLPDCASCHNESAWEENVRFDHDLTAFPLIGMHAAIACEECHVSNAFKNIDMQCAACHTNDDVHEQRMGQDCGQCHNPNGWALWEFDHDMQTDYPLLGVHREILCKDCHKTASTNAKIPPLADDCHSCHSEDNVHGGQYGILSKRCDICHTSDAFDAVPKNRIKDFHLNPSGYDLELSDNCQSCHDRNDIHNGRFGRRCDRCHSITSWNEIIIGQ